MPTRSLIRSFGRFRSLAASGLILAGLAGGSALTATAADAATTSAATPAAACGEGAYFFPQGDALLMTQRATGLRFLVVAQVIATYPVPVGYVYSWDQFPGQAWQSSVQSALNTSFPTQLSSFGVMLGYDFLTGRYTPELVYNSCTWTATFGPESSI